MPGESQPTKESVNTGRVVQTMRSPVFAAVVFLATVVQVCADPLTALATGAGEWGHRWPPAVVITLAALGCLAQAVCVTQAARRPVLALLGALACYLAVALWLGVPTWAAPMHLVVAVALFGVGAARSIPVAAAWAGATVAGAAAALGLWAAGAGAPAGAVVGFVLTEGTALASVSFAGVALGMLWAVLERRTQRARRRALAFKAQQAEAVEASRNAERGRIAQELHDVAGQHLAGLVSLCDASVELAPEHPQQALHLIEEVRAEGRYAAASLYGALGDLRAVDSRAQTPTPDLRRLSVLIDFWRDRGMDVQVETTGDLQAPPVVVSTTAYRAISEGLSNIAKHAPGAPVEVRVEVDPVRLTAAVSNGAARRARADEDELGLGWGLDNLREKLALVDGSLNASPNDRGGWHLGVEIPFPRTTEAERE
ncbi:histidine kinase [Microbacterium trichothecenolyticum]|nr:histidine kinase [Microbacterium trichothecenolyticum]